VSIEQLEHARKESKLVNEVKEDVEDSFDMMVDHIGEPAEKPKPKHIPSSLSK
jgi:hypothetical protein